ncbi:MAG: ankyrin repeat domain-containing protein [Acidobacteriota bacterium]
MNRLLLIPLLAANLVAAQIDNKLIGAVKDGNATLVTTLLAQKANPKAAEADGTTALHWAVRNNDLATATRLIRAGANVKAANRYQITPLFLAAENGSAPMLELLLKSGVDPNAAVNLQETALMTVARTGSVPAAKILLDHGAKIDTREEWHQQTALMWAVVEKHPDMVRELIARGADVNAKSNVNTWERQVTSEPRDKWMPLGGLTPLMFAAREGCLGCAQILADAKADLQVQDPHGVSAPLIAIINGHYDVAAYLVDKGANPNLADDTGRTPLFSAVDFNTMPVSNRPSPEVLHNELSALQLIQKLIDKGANVNAQLTKQQPYRVKLDRGDDTMLSAGTTPLVRAAKAADVPAMKLLLAAKADVNMGTKAGITPLMAAAGMGSKEEDSTGRFKTQEDALEAIELCLKAGADLNATNQQGQTALHAAAHSGFDKVIEFLAAHGAKLDVKDQKGFTAKDTALGLAGGSGGFDGSRKDVHESTAALLTKLGAK